MICKHPLKWLHLSILPLLCILATSFANAQNFSVLYDFDWPGKNDPTWFTSTAMLAQGRDGNIYTTSVLGGPVDLGTVFSMTPSGVLSVPLAFSYQAGGSDPESGLILGRDGNFYGAVGYVYNAVACNGLGSIFKITPKGVLTYLYTFPTTGTVGAPYQVLQGQDGNFYGGTPTSYDVCGVITNATIFKLTPSGTLTTLLETNVPVGVYVLAFQATDGLFYGFDATNPGSIFRISPSGVFKILYQFDGTHGGQPVGLTLGTDGNFYGTTKQGGSDNDGVIFKLTPTGQFSVLHTFGSAMDAWVPQSGVVQANDGYLYGVTPTGGASNNGAIYRISPDGTGYSVLYSFDGVSAASPGAALLQHTNGIFYGLSFGGGLTCWYNQKCGTFYSFDMGLNPSVSLVVNFGKVSSPVQILGQGFKTASKVSFGAATANFKVISDSYMTATVPSGATTGAVTITTIGATLTSNKTFRVTPQISSFIPASGPAGTPVTITGLSLTQASQVTFGGVAATSFTVSSDNQVTATVPAKAKTGVIRVVTAGGGAGSASQFTVTH